MIKSKNQKTSKQAKIYVYIIYSYNNNNFNK